MHSDKEKSNIIITGAAKGIGYFLICELLEEGMNVTVLDLDITPLETLARKFNSLFPLQCDVRDAAMVSDCVRKSIQKFGSVDVAIHNACLCTFFPMEQSDDNLYRDVFNVNYFGALHLSRAVLPYMKEQHSGRIIFTSSGVGIMGFYNISPYASSKAAIESLAKCLAIEYMSSGITFHLFQPPLTKTDSASSLPVPKEFKANPEEVGRGLARHLFSKRFLICHNAFTAFQVRLSYLFSVQMGRFMSAKTKDFATKKGQNSPQ